MGTVLIAPRPSTNVPRAFGALGRNSATTAANTSGTKYEPNIQTENTASAGESSIAIASITGSPTGAAPRNESFGFVHLRSSSFKKIAQRRESL